MRNPRIHSIRVEGQVAYIPLTKGLEALVDVTDLPMLACHLWRADIVPPTHVAYAVTSFSLAGQSLNVRMHSLIMVPPKGILVDHKNGNGLDNRRENLRLATKSNNAANSKLHYDTKSGLKGATAPWGTEKKFAARVKAKGQSHYLGIFPTAEEAHAAYVAAAKALHGEFWSAG